MVDLSLLRGLTPRQRHTQLRDIASSFFFGLAFGVLELIVGVSIRLLDAGPFAVYVLRAAQPAALLFTLWWASLDNGRRSKVGLLVATRGSAVVFLALAALAPGIGWFSLAIVLFYATVHGGTPYQSAVFKENYPDEKRHALVGNGRAAFMLAGAAAGILAGRWIESNGLSRDEMLARFRWTLVFAGAATLFGVAAFSGIRLRTDKQAKRAVRLGLPAADAAAAASKGWRRFLHGLGHLRTHREFRTFLLGYFLFGFAAQMQRPVFDFYVADELEVSIETMGWIYSFLPLAFSFFTMSWWGRAMDKMDAVTARIVFNVAWGVPLAMATISTFFHGSTAVAIVGVSQAFEGAARSGSSLLWILGTLHFARNREEVVAYSAIGMALTGLRGLMAPGAGLLLHDLGFPARDVFLLAIGIILLSTLILVGERNQMLAAKRAAADPATPSAKPRRGARAEEERTAEKLEAAFETSS